jgi:hypothetical protein
MSDPFTLKLRPRGPPRQLCACFIQRSRPGFNEFVFSLKVTNSFSLLPALPTTGKLRQASLPLGFSDMRARFPTIRLLVFSL